MRPLRVRYLRDRSSLPHCLRRLAWKVVILPRPARRAPRFLGSTNLASRVLIELAKNFGLFIARSLRPAMLAVGILASAAAAQLNVRFSHVSLVQIITPGDARRGDLGLGRCCAA